MAKTTGPILAIGAITMANQAIFNTRPVDWRIPVATAGAAIMFTGAEKVWAEGARMLAYTALVAVLLTRIDPKIPSPVESAWIWWQGGSPKKSRSSRRPNVRV